MWGGKEFHIFGAEIQKAREPNERLFHRTESKRLADDRMSDKVTLFMWTLIYLSPDSAKDTLTNACCIAFISLVQARHTGRWRITTEINIRTWHSHTSLNTKFWQLNYHFYIQSQRAIYSPEMICLQSLSSFVFQDSTCKCSRFF